MKQTYKPLIFTALIICVSCSPALNVPSAFESLESHSWQDCAQQAKRRQETGMIDDFNLASTGLLCHAVVTFNDGKTNEALEMLKESAIKDKEDHRAYVLMGRILEESKRYEEALSAYAMANSRFEKIQIPAYDLGRLILKDAGVENAIYFLRNANKRNLCGYWCKGLLAQLYHQTQKDKKAIELYTEMTLENPQDHSAWVGLAAIANGENNFSQETQYLQKAVEAERINKLEPAEQARLFYNLAFALYNDEKFEAARKEIEKALSLDKTAQMYLLQAWCHHKLNNTAMALISYEKALAMNAKLIDAHIGKGDAMMQLKRNKDAIEAYENAIKIKPSDAVVLLKLAYAYVSENQFKKAHAKLKAAQRFNVELPAQLLEAVEYAISKNIDIDNDEEVEDEE